MTRGGDYPMVRVTNDRLPARGSRIYLNGEEISPWVAHYEVVGNLRDATILRLDLLVGSLEIEAPMDGELTLSPEAETFLIKNGWTPP